MNATIPAALLVVAASGGAVLDHVREYVAVEAITPVASDLPGKYAPDSMLTGHDLHLFADGSYIYAEWGCVLPLTIYDKGKWAVSDSMLTLTPDPDVLWQPDVDREFVILRRSGRQTDVLLMGTSRSRRLFDALLQYDSAAAEQALLFTAHPRTERYSSARGRKTKARLLRHAWRPEHFGHGQ